MIEKIKCIENEIMDEIDDAKIYLQFSKDWEETDPEIAKIYLKMSKDEISHANNLNTIAAKLMKDHINPKELSEFPMLITEINSQQIKEATGMYDTTNK